MIFIGGRLRSTGLFASKVIHVVVFNHITICRQDAKRHATRSLWCSGCRVTISSFACQFIINTQAGVRNRSSLRVNVENCGAFIKQRPCQRIAVRITAPQGTDHCCISIGLKFSIGKSIWNGNYRRIINFLSFKRNCQSLFIGQLPVTDLHGDGYIGGALFKSS